MTQLTHVSLVVEDDLSEAVLRRVLCPPHGGFHIDLCYGKKGCAYIRQKIRGFNNAAKGGPFLVLTDLDNGACPAALRQQWLSVPQHPNLLFRVAVREVESWLLADAEGMARFLGIPPSIIPRQPDTIPDPKETLVRLAQKSRSREMRESVAPRPGSTAKVGPDYNGALIRFVGSFWNLEVATRNSESLRSLRKRTATFQKVSSTFSPGTRPRRP